MDQCGRSIVQYLGIPLERDLTLFFRFGALVLLEVAVGFEDFRRDSVQTIG